MAYNPNAPYTPNFPVPSGYATVQSEDKGYAPPPAMVRKK